MNYSIKDPIRNNVCLKINTVVKNDIITRLIEKSIYNQTITIAKDKNIKRYWSNELFKGLYLSRVISIYLNLDKNSYIKNEHFLEKIYNKEIDPTKISQLSIYDIFPENWKYILELRSKKDKLKYKLKPEAMTNAYKCRKCGSRSTSYYEVQTRSADEPMTQFITCLDCETHWKQ